MVASTVCFFFLEILEETFAAGIAKGNPFLKKITPYQENLEATGCKDSVLGSPVRMGHKLIRCISFFISLFKCENNQFYIRFCRNIPCDNFSGKQAQYNTKIIPFFFGLDIGNITAPYEIGCFLLELLQMVGAESVIGRRTVDSRFIDRHFG